MRKNFIKDKRGLMMIVAVGIFATLTVFGLMLQRTVMQSYDSVRSSTAHLSARLISDSVMDHLEYMLRDSDVGFNVGGEGITCEFGGERRETDYDWSPPTHQPTDSNICSELSWIEKAYEGQRIEVVLETKAHAEENESLATAIQAFTAWQKGVYTVPFPGTGDAGARCGMYNPAFGTDANDANIPRHLLPKNFGQTGGTTQGGSNLDQLNYSCNWNKLAFGSALTDRVALPLYYAQLSDGTNLNFVNPFNDGSANNFALRLRTPCKPCFYGDIDDKTFDRTTHRLCTRGDDPTVCVDGQRYSLKVQDSPSHIPPVSDTNFKIIAQWQLSGKCEVGGVMQDCTMIAIPDQHRNSTISNWFVNLQKGDNNIVLRNITLGNDISKRPAEEATFLGTSPSPLLKTLEKPVLTLFLSDAIVYEHGNVPYLEYQLITDHPVSNNTTIMKVEVTVDGNSYKRVFEKPVRMPLIDYALQN